MSQIILKIKKYRFGSCAKRYFFRHNPDNLAKSLRLYIYIYNGTIFVVILQ